MSSPGAGSTVETLITAMQLDASAYVIGSQQIIAADNAMIASFRQVVAAHRAMVTALGGSVPAGGAGVGFGGGGLLSGNVIAPNISFGGWFNNNRNSGGMFNRSGGGGSGGGGGRGGGMFGAYLLLRAIREIEHAFEELGRKALSFSEDALKQAASFDVLQKSFEGIYGSTQAAAQMMTYLRDVAMTSAFHFRDLADAAKGISFAGLDVNRWLPITQGFALAKSNGNIQGGDLEDFIGILRRLQGGNTGLALGPRGLGRYGVSREELETHGAQFDNKGHFIGSVNQAFDAIEAVFDARIKGIADHVKQSSGVTLSNLGDAFQQATIDFGTGMGDNVLGPIKHVTDAMNSLRSSGFFKQLGDTVFQLIGLTGMLGKSTDLKYDFSSADERRDYIKKHFGVYGDPNPNAFQPHHDYVSAYGGLPTRQDPKHPLYTGPLTPRPHTTGDPLLDTMIHIGGYIVKIVEFAKEEVEVLTSIAQHFGISNIGGGGPEAARQEFERKAFADYMDAYLQKLIHGPTTAPTAPTGNDIDGLDDDIIEGNQHLKHIRHSAERIANHFDSKSTAFGGGDIGRYGVTPIEVSSFYKHAASGIGPQFAAFGSSLAKEIDRVVREAMSHGLRQGAFRQT